MYQRKKYVIIKVIAFKNATVPHLVFAPLMEIAIFLPKVSIALVMF
jgi:hypothetical protein